MRARPGHPHPRAIDPDAHWSDDVDVGRYGLDTAAWVALSAAVLSASVGAYATYQSSSAQAAAMEYNALQMQAQAVYARQAGELEASLIERQAAGTLALGEANAAIAEAQAEAAVAAGKIREDAIRRAYNKTQGEVNAAIGKSNLDTTGTPLLVLLENADTAGQELGINQWQTDMEVFSAKANSAVASYEAQQRAASLRGEATLRRFGAGANANALLSQAGFLRGGAGGVRTAGYIGAGSTLLTGAGQAGATYLRYGAKA